MHLSQFFGPNKWKSKIANFIFKGVGKARKKRGGAGVGGGDTTPLTNDDKNFACERCGVKYKTKPGLNYHMKNVNCALSADAKASSLNLVSQNSNSNHGAGGGSRNNHDADENTTNSVFESAYDEQNSSSSFPPGRHTSSSAAVVAAAAATASAEPRLLVQPDVIHKNKCNICLTNENDAQANPKSDKFVTCSECTRTFHPICLNFSVSMIDSLRKYNWQCVECKRKILFNKK
jgi:zinc finger protein ubi-d4